MMRSILVASSVAGALAAHCPSYDCNAALCDTNADCKYNSADSKCEAYNPCEGYTTDQVCNLACSAGCSWNSGACEYKPIEPTNCNSYDTCETLCTASSFYGCEWADSKCGGEWKMPEIPNACQAMNVAASEMMCGGVCGEDCKFDADTSECIGTCPAPEIPDPACDDVAHKDSEMMCGYACINGCTWTDGACTGTFKEFVAPTDAPAVSDEGSASSVAASGFVVAAAVAVAMAL